MGAKRVRKKIKIKRYFRIDAYGIDVLSQKGKISLGEIYRKEPMDYNPAKYDGHPYG